MDGWMDGWMDGVRVDPLPTITPEKGIFLALLLLKIGYVFFNIIAQISR